MACWNQVEKDFGDDETVNFGPRLETGAALYQVDTIACINPSGQVAENPKVSASALLENVCVAANQHLSFFQDSTDRYLKTIAADSVVERVAYSEDGNFLVYGESNRMLHLVFVETQQVVFSKTIEDTEASVYGKCFQEMFFSAVDDKGHCDLVVLASNGMLYLFSHISVLLIAKAIQNEDIMAIKELQSLMTIQTLDISECHEVVNDVTLYTIPDYSTFIVSAGTGKNILCMWEKLNERYLPVAKVPKSALQLVLGSSLTKILITACGRYLMALSDTGVLTMWTVVTLTIIKIWNDIVIIDFYLIDADQHTDSEINMKIVMLTRSEQPDSTQLLVCKLPSLEVAYSLQLSDTTTLAHFPSFQENIVVIEGTHDPDSSSEFISTLRVRCLSEALPEARLNRILYKKRFDEAEEFAKLFELDVELVYKVKSYHLLDLIAPWNPVKISRDKMEEYMSQLRTCLEVIQDDEHVIDCCIKATPPTFEGTLDLLNYARKRLNESKSVKSGLDEDITRQALLTNILETLHRLATYQVAFGIHNFRACEWEKFLRANMLKEFQNHLTQGNLEVAFTLWRRHQSEFERQFKLSTIDTILANIPVQTKSDELMPWLKEDFVPYVIGHLPEGLGSLATWLEQRARDMEATEKDEWPRNAIAMCELLQSSCMSASELASERGMATPHHFATQLCNLSVGYSQVVNRNGANDSPFVKLHLLLHQLRDLQSLHTKYKCYLSLQQYVKETTESLTYRMLDRVMALELIPSTIEKYVCPYMVEHGLNEEKMLFQYIGDLVERSNKMISYMGEAPWEAKAIAVISCIKDPDYKCQAIIGAMQQAYIPWTPEMESLVKQGLELDHPRVAEIKEQCNLYELGKMLTKYNLRNLMHSGSRNSERLIMYILKQHLSSAVEDALHVVRANRDQTSERFVYTSRINLLIKQAKFEMVMELLHSLPEEDSAYCAKSIFHQATIMNSADYSNIYSESDEERVLYTRLAVDALRHLLSLEIITSDESERQTLTTELQCFEKLSALQVEFAEFMTVEAYENSKFRHNLLNQRVAAFLTQQATAQLAAHEQILQNLLNKNPTKHTDWSFTKIYRLSELLGVKRDALRGMLAIAAAKRGQVTFALNMANEQHVSCTNSRSGSVLYKVAYSLCELQSQALSDEVADNLHKVKDLPMVIYQMASEATTICKPGMLFDCVELCRSSRLARDVSYLCESGDYGITVQHTAEQKRDMTNQDPFKEWTFDPPIYKEDGLVMDSAIATPLVYRFCVATLPSTGKGKQSGGFLQTCFLQIVGFLRDNSQMELALQYTNDGLTLFKCCSSLSQSSMDLSRTTKQVEGNMHEQIAILLTKLFNQKKVDHSLALGLCLSLPDTTAWERLAKIRDRAGHQYKRVLELSHTGINLAEILEDCKHLAAYKMKKDLAEWGHRLVKIKVTFKEVFEKDNQEEKKKILQEIIKNKHATVQLIKDYCSTFKLDTDQSLFMYLEQLLLPVANVLDQHGDVSLSATLRCTLQQLNKAQHLIKQITCKDTIRDKLYIIYQKLDPYDYERIDFVLSRMDEIDGNAENELGLKLMGYLKSYKRVAPPSAFEENYRQIADDQLMFTSSNLPPLAKERLPFHALLEKPWKIMSEELKEATVDIWLPIASLLDLHLDHVFVTTIQNIVNQYVAFCKQQVGTNVDKKRCNWDMQKEGIKLFDNIGHLIKQINDLDNALASIQWTIKVLPMGAEKVNALRLSVSVAEMWMKAATDPEEQTKAGETYKKLNEIYRRLYTEQVLFKYKLGEGPLLELSGRPAKLILTLYEHPSIQLRGVSASNVQHLPDIHAAAQGIAEINKLSLSKIHRSLVEKWLPSSLHNKQDEADVTITFDAHVNLDTTVRTEEEISEDEVNLKRVMYILQGGSLEAYAQFLLGMAYTTSHTHTMMCKVRSLRCLFSLLDTAAIESLSKRSMESIREYLQTLLYLVELERLHVPHTEDTFSKCSKEGLVRGIFRNHSHQRRAVRLVADLCLDYKIYDTQLWNSVLQQLLAFQMIEYLGQVLVSLSGVPTLWQVSCIQNMWRSVLLNPLSQAVSPLSDTQVDECWRSANLLHRCPLLLDMEHMLFAKQFMRLELGVCALGCMLLVSREEARIKHISALLTHMSCTELLQQLHKHTQNTRVIPMLTQIKEAVFYFINKQKQFAEIMMSQYMKEFVYFLIKLRDINELLLFIVKNDRLKEALHLVKSYKQYHPSTPAPNPHPNDPYAELRVYIKDHIKDAEHHLPAVPEDADDKVDDESLTSPRHISFITP